LRKLFVVLVGGSTVEELQVNDQVEVLSALCEKVYPVEYTDI
jgi:hypothetical protein